jgi:UDP-2,3-diacylglucosamine pyrophosphatase LpxH
MSNLIKVLICPDTHLPYHDKLAWKTFLEVAKKWKPDKLVILGDLVDFHEVSTHSKDPKKRIPFDEEVRLCNLELDKISKLNVKEVRYLEGNHETRLTRYINDRCPELAGITDVRKLLHIQERGWKWTPYQKHTTIGKISFTHDVGFSGANAAAQSVNAFGGNIVVGHCHRAAGHYVSSVRGDRHVGWAMGWLGDASAIDYRHQARVARESQHGFGIAYIRKSDGIGWLHFVPIIKGNACIDGKIYNGR